MCSVQCRSWLSPPCLSSNPDYIAPLLHDHRGKYILGTAVGLLAIAILSMRRMMRRVTAA